MKPKLMVVNSVLRRRTRGLTMIEVMLAIAVLGIVLAAVSLSTLTSVRQTSVAGQRTQATQVLNYFGRRLAGGDSMEFGGLTWDYGELQSTFNDLQSDGSSFDADLFRVSIGIEDSIGIGSSSIPHYRVEVCWEIADQEYCIEGDTAGPPISSPDGAILPGIN